MPEIGCSCSILCISSTLLPSAAKNNKLGNRDVACGRHDVRGRHDVSVTRLKACIAVLAPHEMSNVCHTFGPQGAPHKLQVHVISITAKWSN